MHDTPEAPIAGPDNDLIVIVIATPNATHLAVAQAALQAGKHVVVDKPFTLTLLEAQRLDALATAKERVMSVFHNRRWDGDFITVQRLIASGELNRVTHFESHFDRIRPLVRARWRESAESVAGLWFDLGPHLLHQALPLFGWPQALFLDAATLRDGALSEDWCMAHAALRPAACHAARQHVAGRLRPALRRARHARQLPQAGPGPAGRRTECRPPPGLIGACRLGHRHRPFKLSGTTRRSDLGRTVAAGARLLRRPPRRTGAGDTRRGSEPGAPWQAMAVMALMALIELGHTSLREHRVCDAEPLQQG